MTITSSSKWLLGGAVALTAACSAPTWPSARHAPPGGFDLRAPLAAAPASPYGEAYGARQLHQRGGREHPNLERYLKPSALPESLLAEAAVEAHSTPTAAPMRTTRAPKRASPVVLRALDDATLVAVADAPSPAPDAQRYAVRELKSEKQQTFRGGDVLVIGASTLLLVLLVLLLLVLIVR